MSQTLSPSAPVSPAESSRARTGDARSPASAGGIYLLDRSEAERHRVVRGAIAADLPVGKARRGADGWLEVKVGRSEVIYLPPATASDLPAPGALAGAICDPGLRHGYWFTLAGADVGKVFTHGCEMDMRPTRFPNLSVTQTLLFRTTVTIVRDDVDGQAAYHLLGCNSLAHHILKKIRHVQSLHGGRMIELADLQVSSR